MFQRIRGTDVFYYRLLAAFIILLFLIIVTRVASSKGIDKIVYNPDYVDSIQIVTAEECYLISSKPNINEFAAVLKQSRKYRQCHCKGGYKTVEVTFYSLNNNISRLRIQYHLNMPARIRANDFEYSNDAFVRLVEGVIQSSQPPS